MATKKQKPPYGFVYAETKCRSCGRRLVIREHYAFNVISLDEHFEELQERPDADKLDPTDELNGSIMRSQMLDYLKYEDKEVALLMEEGYDQREIAVKLDIPYDNIVVSVARIRKRLKEFL